MPPDETLVLDRHGQGRAKARPGKVDRTVEQDRLARRYPREIDARDRRSRTDDMDGLVRSLPQEIGMMKRGNPLAPENDGALVLLCRGDA